MLVAFILPYFVSYVSGPEQGPLIPKKMIEKKDKKHIMTKKY